MKTLTAPQLATSSTGTIHGKGSVIKDKYPALVANEEAILNAGAAKAFKKVTGMSIETFNAMYAPKGAKTKVVDGVVNASGGQSPFVIKKPDNDAINAAADAQSKAMNAKLNDNSPSIDVGSLSNPASNLGYAMAANARNNEIIGDQTVKPVTTAPAFPALTPSPKPQDVQPPEISNTLDTKPVDNTLIPTATSVPGVSKYVSDKGTPVFSNMVETSDSIKSPVPLLGANNSTPQSQAASQVSGYESLKSFENAPGLISVSPADVNAKPVTQQRAAIPAFGGGAASSAPVINPVMKNADNSQQQSTASNQDNGSSPVQQSTGQTQTSVSADQVMQKNPNATAIDINNAEKKVTTQQSKAARPEAYIAPTPISPGNRPVQSAPPRLSPQQVMTQDKGFISPRISGLLSPDNKAALNDLAARYTQQASRGTGNFSDALATKYAQKGLEDLMGKDTQDTGAAQANANQAQNESQFQREDKQKKTQEAWNQMMQATGFNYDVQKDQQNMTLAEKVSQQKAQSDSAELQQKREDALDTPYVKKTPVLEDDGRGNMIPTGMSSEETTSRRQELERQKAGNQEKTLDDHYKEAMAAAATPEQKQAISDRYNQLLKGK